MRAVEPGAWAVCEYAALYKRGLPPVAGGSLDQARWFTAAAAMIWALEAAHKAEQLALPDVEN